MLGMLRQVRKRLQIAEFHAFTETTQPFALLFHSGWPSLAMTVAEHIISLDPRKKNDLDDNFVTIAQGSTGAGRKDRDRVL